MMDFTRMKTDVFLTLTLMYSICLVPCNGGLVYFLDTQVVASEGNQFSLRIGHTGTLTQIVNAIVRVDNSDQDFVGSSQVAAFAPGGDNVASVTFMVFDDSEPEIEETYTFTLQAITSGTDVTIPNMATVIIQANDDAYGVFSITNVSLTFL
ncbi:adhesion G-protein coupled receptor V1-like [Mercenaria mercenaria]|uniref:adhesion G-protein coupled receptor V1-like n=1 Tax=Mercenaria mercenaria TaxID=6596 RepID=UPI00234F085F|nr:adhesion G-protein coupled receptor V1-like [Mercenaria mercenaria]